MATVPSGLIGGVLGAIAAGVAIRATRDDPGPAATVWAMYFGDGDPTHYERQGIVIDALYGAGAGAVFLSFAGSLDLGLTTVGGAVLWALVWSAALAIVAVGFWSMVVIGDSIGSDLDTRALVELGALHLGFGIVLGLWVYYVPGI